MSRKGMPHTKQIMEERRKVAEKRQAAYDALTLDEKIAKLPPEPHAAKQRARLLALKNGKAPAQTVEPTQEASQEPKKLKAKERRAAQRKEDAE